MFAINNIDIQNLADFEIRKPLNDTRTSHIINSYLLENSKERYAFISEAPLFPYARSIEIPYMINGKKQFLPLKGTRPNFNKIYEIANTDTAASMSRYLIKFSNKEVWICNTDISYTGTPIGVRIGTMEEDLKIVFCEFQAAGGGGNGGNSGIADLAAGRGGGGGGYLLIALELEHEAYSDRWKKNSFPIMLGKRGASITGRNIAGDGGNTGLSFTTGNINCCAMGGIGAKDGTAGIGGSYVCSNVPFVHFIFGKDGGHSISATQTFELTKTPQAAPIGEENMLLYPERNTAETSISGGGFAGGCSVLGTGGAPTQESGSNGNDGKGYGSGGGGGHRKNLGTTTGGTGAGGYIAIYY